jgi:hypothetical protein
MAAAGVINRSERLKNIGRRSSRASPSRSTTRRTRS